ncbi:Asp23/Gls24 family envelope stress response protein [Nocardiopsis potens]|uniref:Asp23/Gls24 family envelope stress response protein n=1 Tax=Nocardiopsis potens TaxID=1246458 RepID=UPI000347EB60|nr:Asp23/Gls24 family envelope stress response protein [Nocardiopsis potens]
MVPAGGGEGAATAPAPPVPGQRAAPAERTGGAADAGARGRTEVSARVVEKIAVRTAAEQPAVRPLGGRGPFGAPEPARAQARLSGDTAVIRLTVALAYPVPLRSTAAGLRTRVAERVEELTGMRVPRVDIDVSELVRAGRVG